MFEIFYFSLCPRGLYLNSGCFPRMGCPTRTKECNKKHLSSVAFFHKVICWDPPFVSLSCWPWDNSVTPELSILWSWPWQTSLLSLRWVPGAARGSALPKLSLCALASFQDSLIQERGCFRPLFEVQSCQIFQFVFREEAENFHLM